MNPRAFGVALAAVSGLLFVALSSHPRLAPLVNAQTQSHAPLRVLLVGGGPNLSHNQAAIESNLHYVRRLLPADASVRTLFADGNPRTSDVLYQDAHGNERYRPSQFTSLDGPTKLSSLDAEFHRLSVSASAPLLLYFTGHGSPDEEGQYRNNQYDMWGGDTLTVQKLAGYLKTLPPQTPVTLVMVECFSGAFGNLLFDGDNYANPRLCGFFASVDSQPAAGCTSAVNEAEYHDFTSYFFAALSGQDRVHRRITGADYNSDGQVGMNEAFAYTLIHDHSIDTPVCTSDVFLRHYVPTKDPEIFRLPYSTVYGWASPAQQAVLRALSAQLHLSGEDRLARAYRTFRGLQDSDDEDIETRNATWIRFVRTAKSAALAHTLRAEATPAVQARFAALLQAEAGNPLWSGS